MSANTSETNKRQKVNDDVNMDDLFEEETCCGPTIVSQRPVGDGGVVAPDTSLKIPEGSKLAYNPGRTNSIKALVLAATPKTNTGGPTSIKLTCQILSVKNPGADVFLAGPVMVIAMSKNEKVKTEAGIDVNARLITTNMTPVLFKSTQLFSITLTLGRITQKGLKEKAVSDLSPGAEVELTDVYYATSGTGFPWLTATDFKPTQTGRLPIDGARIAVGAVAKAGMSLVVGTALNCVAFRGETAPSTAMQPSFDATKAILSDTKENLTTALGKTFEAFTSPIDPLLLEGSEGQIAPILSFYKTKVPTNVDPGTKGALFDNAKLSLLNYRRGDTDALTEVLSGGAVVASALGAQRSYEDSKYMGPVHVLTTKQTYIPSIEVIDQNFGPRNLLTINGPTLKVPLAVLAAPFGVNERTTAELLMENVIPGANMAFMPAKAKVFTRDHGNSDYVQQVSIDSADQFTIDILTTFRNTSLRVSPGMVTELYNNGGISIPVQLSGESLIDMMPGDRKPILSTLAGGGVASLRETAIGLSDETLEFYAVVADMMKITQAEGNMHCGTDATIGDSVFLLACGGDASSCATMLKKGEVGVFAVRVKAKTTAVASD